MIQHTVKIVIGVTGIAGKLVMVKFVIAILGLLGSTISLAAPIAVSFTQDFGENGFVTGSFSGEDIDLDGRIVFSDSAISVDKVTAYSLQFTPGLMNKDDITSFVLDLSELSTLDYSIGGPAVVVTSGEAPLTMEHFYNCGDESNCFVGDVDNFYSPGAGNKATLLTFNDVLTDHWAYSFIEILANNNITAGCGGGSYCPEDSITRAQMAVFLERGIRGGEFNPPAAAGDLFLDVGATDFAASFIEQLFADGITAGCGNGNYCPNTAVTRDQMAVFLLRAKYGADYSPPAATGAFADVPVSHWAAVWVEQLAAEGITAGCGSNNFCPQAAVSRAQMAVFLLRAIHGQNYSPPHAAGIFDDVPPGSFARDWIEQLAAENITSGCGGNKYCPIASVTRDQMAVFLVKAFGL